MATIALQHFCEGYLHADWDLDYSDTDAALSDFLASEPHLGDTLLSELMALIRGASEERLRQLISVEYACYYDPAADGITYKGWLQQLARLPREVVD